MLSRRILPLFLAACGQPSHAVLDAMSADASHDSSTELPFGDLELIIGGTTNVPVDWPAAAGTWNGKAARFNAVRQMLVFETSRQDITGGQLDATATDPNGGSYFISGPGGGTLDPSPTSVLYVANADGSSPRCIGCTDIVDGTDGVEIYKAALSTGAVTAPQRQPLGTTIDANRNKDLPFWHPSGDWIIAGIEMHQHGLSHHVGNSEVGGWVDLWAISTDGKTWVQLTDFASTYTAVNATSSRPLQCAESACAAGCQSPVATNSHPYAEYACSAAGAPPPVVGVMRPVISHGMSGSIAGSAKIAWSERVGWKASGYSWAGPLQAAIGDLALVDVGGGKLLPAIGSYERNLTPMPEALAGRGLWKPADGHVIGRGYETWGFSIDDHRLLIASDSFLFSDKLSSSVMAWQTIGGSTQGFIDITSWDYRSGSPAYDDLTKYDSVAYPYTPNGSATAVSQFGHLEEPVVMSATATPFMAFASSANLAPAWDPDSAASSGMTFALEVWIMRADRTAAAVPITHLSDSATRFLTYPTDLDHDVLYITSAPQTGVASNAPGVTYRYRVAPL